MAYIIIVKLIKQVKLLIKYKIIAFVDEKKYLDKSDKMLNILYNDSKK
tara:strand:- start:1602 stop:1745 length:144 start_codon:yes stop_codon:yes gene_type:complete